MIAMKANPGRPPERADFANLGIPTSRGDPAAPGCQGIWQNKVAKGLYRVCTRRAQGWLLRPCPPMARPRGQFWTFLSHSQDGLKQPTFSPQLLGDNGGARSPAQREVAACHLRSMGSHCRTTLEPIVFRKTRPWLVGRPLLWQGSRVQYGQVRGLCLNPCTCMPLKRWDLGMGYGWGLSVSCPEAPLPQSMA